MTSTLHNPDYRALIDHLVALRTKAKVSQQELAVRLAKPQSFISKYERLERRLDVAEFAAVVTALGFDAAIEFAAALKEGRANST